ncbi:MAG: SAM-dependent DNA methyltransferase [Chlorobi bacterium]|nr:SAM-dependent DNA methyltransferase [Chlorobiota bacterium]
MDTVRSGSSDRALIIGDIFTRIAWGEFAIKQFDIFKQWMSGATVLDPTMGTGNLLEALITYGLRKGYALKQLPASSLYGNELSSYYHQQALQKFSDKYGLDMSKNFWNEDILDLPPRRFDILFGNPPWQNFVDLPDAYKAKIKSQFFKYDLVGNSQNLLLGGSRIDIAALMIQRSIKDFLLRNGNAYFFMPLSLLLNDGANRHFRTYKINDVKYAPVKVFDFNNLDVFNGISTRYGLVCFKRDLTASFPIPYERYENGNWNSFLAKPLLHPTDPLSILPSEKSDPLIDFSPVEISKESTPRQGINTCGANSIFFFSNYKQVNKSTCLVNDSTALPVQYVHPLLTSKNFKGSQPAPRKWVLLPYSNNGRPLELNQIKAAPRLWRYLKQNEPLLRARKGSLIGAWIKKGYWWALLGVGPYNFMPFKVVWEAYGRSRFKPMITTDNWQANQSLQAFIPTKTREEAERVLGALQHPAIEAYLLSLKMDGTMNWAQPGKIKKLLQFKETNGTLFD